MIFDLTGRLKRERKKPCNHCGAMTHCDDCWEHVSDWSPFGVWHCLLCHMPQAFIDGGIGKKRCDFCGWDERTETGTAEIVDGFMKSTPPEEDVEFLAWCEARRIVPPKRRGGRKFKRA
jgi:hypothetical protein